MDVSYSVSGIGGLDGKVSVDNSPSSPDKGLITIDDTVENSGELYLQIMIGSSTYGPYTTKVLTQNDAAPTSSMGSGGSDSTLASVTTTSFTQMSGTHTGDPSLDVIISDPSDFLRLSAVFNYGVSGSPPKSGAMICIGQYSGDGGITWSDMGSEVQGSFASYSDHPPLGVIRIPGAMNHTWSVTGLSAATYQVRLMGKLAPSSDSLTPLDGSATSSRS